MENDYLMLNGPCPALKNTLPDREQELAILFLDIRNFTGLMEARPGQTVIQVVRRLFTGFNQIVKSFQGKVVEVTGDNLYAVFGLQDGLKQAVNNAYMATKVIFKTVAMFNDGYAEPYYGVPLEVGMGLHAGKVFVGEFGLDNAPQLSVMGLPVNIASRLQAKTKDLNNDLIISEYAYSMIDDDDVAAGIQKVELQGILHSQQVRLAGKPYVNNRYLNTGINADYLLAISG